MNGSVSRKLRKKTKGDYINGITWTMAKRQLKREWNATPTNQRNRKDPNNGQS